MPKLKYVGRKSGPIGETAFSDLTGITWFPGTVKEIRDQALIVRMLRHPDVFARADDEPEDDGDAAPPVQEAAATPAAVVQPVGGEEEEEEDPLVAAQKARMAAFTSTDTGNENDLMGGDPVAPGATADPVVETPVGEGDTSAMTLAPGGTVAAAPAADAVADGTAAAAVTTTKKKK